MFKEVRFQDLVDFSRTTFGRYKVEIVGPPTEEQWEQQDGRDLPTLGNTPFENPLVRFENNTVEKEADLLHVTFDSPALFINNRFRSTLDLTGATFAQPEHTTPLCLSYNRINRLIFASQHLSNVRRIDAPACQENAVLHTTSAPAEALPSI